MNAGSQEGKTLLPAREVIVEFTTYCGAQCIMCPRHAYDFPWEHMDMSLYEDILDQAVELGVISLDTCGFGDIFMDPNVERKLAHAKQKYPFLKILASTTGHLLNQKNLPLLKYIDTLRFSVYGMTKEVYETVHRGSLRFEKIMENIEAVLALSKGARPYIIMSFLVLPENKHEIEAFKSFEPRVDEVMVWMPHSFGGYYAAENNTTVMRSCGRPFRGSPFIRTNGEVSVCCFDYNRKLVIGDLKVQKLRDVLQSDELSRIRRIHAQTEFRQSNIICRNCDQIYDRSQALVYATNKNRKVGVITSHPDLVNDMLK